MQQVVKILVIRFSSIGDMVLTTPVLRCLKNQLDGEVELHYLTKKQYKSIVDSNPNVSKVYTIEKSTNEVVKNLKNEGYDYIIDLHKNLRSKRVIKKLKCLSFSFEKLNYEKWLMTAFKINKLPNIHIVERYLNAVKYLGVENDGLGLEYYIPEKDEVHKNDLPVNFQKEYISFAIGAQHATKCLPEHKIISICKELKKPIVLLGGKEDAEKAERIVKVVGANVFSACGTFNLNQSASILKQSKVLITHDTGLMHIGVALNVNVVSVWGNTIPEFGMYPYYPTQPDKYVMIENKNLNCRPCSKIGYDKCPKKHFKCMEDIDVKEVVKHV
ncbi:MAG: glycosyltransferase family 9 protein [Flavobacteriales bacterium]|nr:glycosyltransferase family 9 protein [Flavobacteriales bacterium]MCB9363572.1 glycosyltransferase family 9 protein [Flavobacteriales bacterium]